MLSFSPPPASLGSNTCKKHSIAMLRRAGRPTALVTIAGARIRQRRHTAGGARILRRGHRALGRPRKGLPRPPHMHIRSYARHGVLIRSFHLQHLGKPCYELLHEYFEPAGARRGTSTTHRRLTAQTTSSQGRAPRQMCGHARITSQYRHRHRRRRRRFAVRAERQGAVRIGAVRGHPGGHQSGGDQAPRLRLLLCQVRMGAKCAHHYLVWTRGSGVQVVVCALGPHPNLTQE